ncbi:MAG: hypothetical protein KJ593_00380 [Candidatus Omnitrophica bacterium]|nr:hypothetical protein [Candidatus Omnitrophota bacterium]
MKKITVLVQTKDVEPTLKVLAGAGVLHIEHQRAPRSESVSRLEENLKSLSKAIETLPVVQVQENTVPDYNQASEGILALLEAREVIREDLKKIKKNIDLWREWGDFPPKLIEELKDSDIRIYLAKLNKKQLSQVPQEVVLEEIFKKGNIFYCALISKNKTTLPFETLSLPNEGLNEMILKLERAESEIAQIEKRLFEFAKYKNALSSYRQRLKSLLEFHGVRAGMGSFARLAYLKGYCPDYSVKTLEQLAEREKWGLLIEEPDKLDNVPTLIKNPRWIQIIEPVFNMIKTIPGYRELDISFWFLLFFSVFFGILIGDAGYGLVFLLINLVCHIKFKDSRLDKSVFFLMYVLSSSAIIWGVLSATFFGKAYLPAGVGPLLPFLKEHSNVQALCFFIGALHLSIAHFWRLLRKLPGLNAASEAGWIAVLWAAYFLARLLILGASFPVFAKWLFGTGTALIILFSSPRKNILKGIGFGIGDFLLHVINSFTDVVSYIRLFAVGVATVAVADAFNQMASSIGYNNLLMGFLTALILLFGHTLNILLGAMAILVHGVRLNVLEFSSHLNMEWSGTEYAPFKIREE